MRKRNFKRTFVKVFCLALTLAMLLPLCFVGQLPVLAEDNATLGYVSDGLVSLFDGEQNSRDGHNVDATVWEDLVSKNDLPVTIDDNTAFTLDGLHTTATQHYFPSGIVSLVNGDEFTVELVFGDFVSIGGEFNTFLNSTNDKFALFRRNSNNVIEFKFAGNVGSERPTVSDGLTRLDNATITVTYKVGGKCRIYVDGKMAAEVACPNYMGADDLFIGHASENKLFDTTYKCIRFYNRELTADEIKANAQADGTYNNNELADNATTHITVAQPRTNIVGDVAVTREINSAAELQEMMSGDKLPAAAIYTFNSNMEILDKDGNAFSTFAEVLTATNYSVLPILVPVDASAVDGLAKFVKNTLFTDICIMSKDPELVNTARTKMTSIRGAVDFTEKYANATELTKEQCIDIRYIIKSHAASVAVLPAHLCAQDTVQYLYDGQINVWARAEDNPTATQKYYALLSGAVGVISDDTNGILDIACNKLATNTMTRVPLNVGHRGIPSQAPENTVEGSLHAYEVGADCIELDIYLTKDGKVVVMHDGTTGRTCDKDLPVEASTWEQLSQLYVNKGYENNETYKNCRIPLLEDYLEAFKGKDCRLFIEIKSGKTAIVPAMKELIDKYDMYDQCSVITFNTSIMTAMRNVYPEMSVGALCSGYLDETDSDADMKTVMSLIGSSNATLNPSYSGYGANAIRASLIRGIGVFPWTFRGDLNAYLNHFVWGYSGLTGDYANVFSRVIKDWQVEGVVDSLAEGESTTLSALLTYYTRKTATYDGTVVAIDGNQSAVDGNTIKANGEGDVSVLLNYTYRLGSERVNLYSQPFVVEMVDNTPDEPADTDEGTVDTDDNTAGTDDNTVNTQEAEGTQGDETVDAPSVAETEINGTEAETATEGEGCGSVIGGATLLLCGALALTATLAKKKED